jgi:hypothetical protein
MINRWGSTHGSRRSGTKGEQTSFFLGTLLPEFASTDDFDPWKVLGY